jgi:hypothetical protein
VRGGVAGRRAEILRAFPPLVAPKGCPFGAALRHPAVKEAHREGPEDADQGQGHLTSTRYKGSIPVIDQRLKLIGGQALGLNAQAVTAQRCRRPEAPGPFEDQ